MTAGVANRDLVADLRQSILTGRYRPDEHLAEQVLATTFGTRRTNVRNALFRLEREGLVIYEPKRGARVRVVKNEEILETISARGALEKLLAREAAKTANGEDCQKLKDVLTAMRATHKADNFAEFYQCSSELFIAIRAIAGNATVNRILDGLLFWIIPLQDRTGLLSERADSAMVEYEAIIDAICANDPEVAELEVQRHFDSVISCLQRALMHEKNAARQCAASAIHLQPSS